MKKFDPLDVDWWIKSWPGRFALLALAGGLIWLFARQSGREKAVVSRYEEATGAVAQLTEAAGTKVKEYHSGLKALPAAKTMATDQPPVPVTRLARTHLPINLFSSQKAPPLGAEYVPYGYPIKCMLWNTVDSTNLQTPIIGLVLEDVWHDGRLIVEAGVEVHGLAQNSPIDGRIGAQGNWYLVWRLRGPRNGLELKISGLALAYTPTSDGEGFRLSDGSAGLPGYTTRNDKYADLKLFAASFLGAFAGGLQDTVTSDNGIATRTTTTGSLTNGLTAGAQATLNRYAQKIQQEVAKNGFYTICPAGSTLFYLYVTQTIDLSKARIGSSSVETLLPNRAAFSSPNLPTLTPLR